MLNESTVNKALAEIGYDRMACHVYRATWSTEIEHFLYLELYGTPKEYLAVDFGLRNRAAESFAIRATKMYDTYLHELLQRDRRNDCLIRGSLGELASWGIRSSVSISSLSDDDLAVQITQDIKQKLFPVIRSVTDASQFLKFLAANAEPCPWFRCNGAIRAAMIAYLGRQTKMTSEETCSLLSPHKREISYHLVDNKIDADAYIKKIMDEAPRGSVTD